MAALIVISNFITDVMWMIYVFAFRHESRVFQNTLIANIVISKFTIECEDVGEISF